MEVFDPVVMQQAYAIYCARRGVDHASQKLREAQMVLEKSDSEMRLTGGQEFVSRVHRGYDLLLQVLSLPGAPELALPGDTPRLNYHQFLSLSQSINQASGSSTSGSSQSNSLFSSFSSRRSANSFDERHYVQPSFLVERHSSPEPITNQSNHSHNQARMQLHAPRHHRDYYGPVYPPDYHSLALPPLNPNHAMQNHSPIPHSITHSPTHPITHSITHPPITPPVNSSHVSLNSSTHAPITSASHPPINASMSSTHSRQMQQNEDHAMLARPSPATLLLAAESLDQPNNHPHSPENNHLGRPIEQRHPQHHPPRHYRQHSQIPHHIYHRSHQMDHPQQIEQPQHSTQIVEAPEENPERESDELDDDYVQASNMNRPRNPRKRSSQALHSSGHDKKPRPVIPRHPSLSRKKSHLEDENELESDSDPKMEGSEEYIEADGEGEMDPMLHSSELKQDSAKKGRRQPRMMSYDQSLVYPLNDTHLFLLVQTKTSQPELSDRACVELLLDETSVPPDSPFAHSVLSTGPQNSYTQQSFQQDCSINSTYTFRTHTGTRYAVHYSPSGVTISPMAPSEDQHENSPPGHHHHHHSIPASHLHFIHFPPDTTVTASPTSSVPIPLGSLSWWRIQACVGEAKHRGMPGDGAWTARWDKDQRDRRPARILEHFGKCKWRQGWDPVGSLARLLLGKE